MAKSTKPADVELASRILRAAGIDDEVLAAAADTQLRELTAKDRTAAKETGEPVTDPRELWAIHSAKTLHRFFAGRCISCRNWVPKEADGTCVTVSEAIGFKTAGTTTAAWGCASYAEIPAAETETRRARTELAIDLGLLPSYPDPDAEPAAVEEP